MNMNELTKDAKYLLCSMYAKYLDRIKDNISKIEARNFQNIDFIKENIMSEWSKEDVLDTCIELQRHKYISATPGNNTLFCIQLTTEAIATLELEFKEPTLKERIESVLDFAAKVKAAIPFS